MVEDHQFDLADFLQRFSTKVLWHFTGYKKTQSDSYRIICQILSAKTLKISAKEPILKMPSGTPRLGFKCSCMCDIPFKDLRIHTFRYGHFGIAFHKLNAIKSHFNPVFYLHNNHFLLKYAEGLIEELEALSCQHERLDRALEKFLTILGTYVKLADLNSVIKIDCKSDEDGTNNFYYEREWRSAYKWNFNPSDVAAIMVPTKYISNLRSMFSSSFSEVPIISSEMVEVL